MTNTSSTTIHPIPCLLDNYAYVLLVDQTRHAVVIDPSKAEPVQSFLSHTGARLTAILCTHHHPDHVGGVADLLAANTAPIAVYGHASEQERIPWITHPLSHGDSFQLGNETFHAMHVPGHTLGALAYQTSSHLFTGDTLFVAGCGRLFEGTAEMMHHSLSLLLDTLSDDVQIWPGHEYAEKNLRFAAMVEPDNKAVHETAQRVALARTAGSSTPGIPSTLRNERAINPFLRTHSAQVQSWAHAMGCNSTRPVDVLQTLRDARNKF